MRLSFIASLKACAKKKDLYRGSRIHADIRGRGLLEKDTYIGNTLISMYAKCGALVRAAQVVDELPFRDAVSWNALIAGYVQHGQGNEALGCFHRMQSEGLSPDAFTYSCLLKACGIMQDIHLGKHFHGEIVSRGFLEHNVVLGNALVDMYAKCGLLLKARQVLHELPDRNVVSWCALIAGYVELGQGQEALDCFQRMRGEVFSPDAITYACALKACSIIQDVDMGKRIHDEIVNQGLLETTIMLGNALVDMYAKCGELFKAAQVLDELPLRNVVSWNALIAGYVQKEKGQEALGCFQRMRSEVYSPDAITYACVLKACGLMQDVEMGERIHDEIVSRGVLEKSVTLGNALVDMYAKCGALFKAQQVLDELPIRNIVSWSALITGYAQEGQGQEAMSCFQRMRGEGFFPDVVSWTALIGGYAQQGLAKEALECFQGMQQEGISPDAITFINVLNACSHSGLVDEGQKHFDNMKKKYGIAPNKEHYTCMVDLFGRARLFDKAVEVIKMMPSSDHSPVWFSLLSACQKWGNVKLGRVAFERAVQLERCNAAAYVLMSDIYTAAGMQEEADNIERMRIKNTAWN